MFVIEYAEGIADDLANLPAYRHRQILDYIEEQFTHQPTRQTRNKKILIGLISP